MAEGGGHIALPMPVAEAQENPDQALPGTGNGNNTGAGHSQPARSSCLDWVRHCAGQRNAGQPDGVMAPGAEHEQPINGGEQGTEQGAGQPSDGAPQEGEAVQPIARYSQDVSAVVDASGRDSGDGSATPVAAPEHHAVEQEQGNGGNQGWELSAGQQNGAAPQEGELQDVKLVVTVGNGNTIEIPLEGHLTLRSSRSSPSRADTEEDDAETQHDAAELKYLNDMRGWIVAVAALFATLSFDAMNQRPSWMPEPKFSWYFLWDKYKNKNDPAEKNANRMFTYVLFNTLIFSTSIFLMVMLILPNRSTKSARGTLMIVRVAVISLAFFGIVNFSYAISNDRSITAFVLVVMTPYIIGIMYVACTSIATSFRERRAVPPVHARS